MWEPPAPGPWEELIPRERACSRHKKACLFPHGSGTGRLWTTGLNETEAHIRQYVGGLKISR